MRLLLISLVVIFSGFASVQAQQQEKLTITKSKCEASGLYGWTIECTINAYMVTSGVRTRYILDCGQKGKMIVDPRTGVQHAEDQNACANLIVKDVWPFSYIADGKYCTAHTIKGKDGRDYPVKCIKLLSEQELIYAFVKDDDFWCSQDASFCKK